MAFRPNWYEDRPRRGPFGAVSEWSGLRWVLTLNIAVFLLQLVTSDRNVLDGRLNFAEWLALRAWWPHASGLLMDPFTEELVHGGFNWFFPIQLVTYSFLHAGLGHIFFNLLFLFFMGPELEAALGRRGFLRLYVGGAIFGGLIQWAYWIVQGDPTPVIGASGAVYTVMTLYALKWPHRTILLMMIVPVPMWLLAAFRVVSDALAFSRGEEGNTAVLVHLGGAAFGLIWWKGGGVITAALERRRRNRAMREFQDEAADRREMDRLLAKIQATGINSLETRERDFLNERSRIVREGRDKRR